MTIPLTICNFDSRRIAVVRFGIFRRISRNILSVRSDGCSWHHGPPSESLILDWIDVDHSQLWMSMQLFRRWWVWWLAQAEASRHSTRIKLPSRLDAHYKRGHYRKHAPAKLILNWYVAGLFALIFEIVLDAYSSENTRRLRHGDTVL